MAKVTMKHRTTGAVADFHPSQVAAFRLVGWEDHTPSGRRPTPAAPLDTAIEPAGDDTEE